MQLSFRWTQPVMTTTKASGWMRQCLAKCVARMRTMQTRSGLKKRNQHRWCANLWLSVKKRHHVLTIGAIKVTRYSIGTLLLVALFVRPACKLPSYMVLLLHGAITFFVISCSANIYKPFLNWRIWEKKHLSSKWNLWGLLFLFLRQLEYLYLLCR